MSNTQTREYVGQIMLNGVLDVTDPCYERNTWCRLNNVEVMPGRYNCYVLTQRDSGYDYVAGIAIVRDTEPEWDGTPNNFTEQIGEIGVDSGMAGFFVNKPDYTQKEWEQFCDMASAESKNYMLTDESFFSDSGYGDGGYPVYAWMNQDGHIVGLFIQYLG